MRRFCAWVASIRLFRLRRRWKRSSCQPSVLRKQLRKCLHINKISCNLDYMGKMGQIFGKNGILWGQKSALAFLLILAVVFAEGCSRKMPCPDVNKATAKASKQKKAKKVKTKMVEGDAGDGGGDGSEAAVETPTEET